MDPPEPPAVRYFYSKTVAQNLSFLYRVIRLPDQQTCWYVNRKNHGLSVRFRNIKFQNEDSPRVLPSSYIIVFLMLTALHTGDVQCC